MNRTDFLRMQSLGRLVEEDESGLELDEAALKSVSRMSEIKLRTAVQILAARIRGAMSRATNATSPSARKKASEVLQKYKDHIGQYNYELKRRGHKTGGAGALDKKEHEVGGKAWKINRGIVKKWEKSYAGTEKTKAEIRAASEKDDWGTVNKGIRKAKAGERAQTRHIRSLQVNPKSYE